MTQIFTNGYITFGMEFDSRNPVKLSSEMMSDANRSEAKKRRLSMLAPLWTDNDATHGDVYYHIYDLNNAGSTSTDLARVQVCKSYSFSSCMVFIICHKCKETLTEVSSGRLVEVKKRYCFHLTLNKMYTLNIYNMSL